MSEVREATLRLLEERPDLSELLERIVEIDKGGPWEMKDTPLDSGQFGEIVSYGITEKVDGGYRLADREAVAAALESGPPNDGRESETDRGSLSRNVSTLMNAGSNLSKLERGSILTGLVLVALVRVVFAVPGVFRDGHVVLTGNDPYRYRYWVEYLLTSDLVAFNPGALNQLPAYVTTHDTLMIVSMWWFGAILGGTPGAAGLVLSMYPVVAAMFVAGCIYLVAVHLTADRRVGLSALLLFALTPVSAYRMMLGFGDHHAFDLGWLALILLCLVFVASRKFENVSPRMWSSGTWLVTAGLALGVAGHVLSWRGGPLMLAPIGIYAIVGAFAAQSNDQSPLAFHAPLLVGIGAGSIAVVMAHVLWGWLPLYRAIAPLLVFLGSSFAVGVSEAASRRELGTKTAGTALLVLVLGGFAIAWVSVPDVSDGLTLFIEYIAVYTGSGIAETQSLFSRNLGLFVAPLLFFGFIFVLALPMLVLVTWRLVETRDQGWLAVTVYGWFFLAFSVLQVRFADSLSIPFAVLAGVGFIAFASKLDMIEWAGLLDQSPDSEWGGVRTDGSDDVDGLVPLSIPDRGTLVSLGVLFVLVTSLSVIQIPVKQSQLIIDDPEYETATWMGDYASERGWEYPESYVFSSWDKNMFFNYFANSHSEDYAFAKRHYDSFILSNSPGEWYDRLDHRTGFIVIQNASSGVNPMTIQHRLAQNYGSATDSTPAVSHYRAVYESSDGSLIIYTLVQGATVRGTAGANDTVIASVDVDVPGTTFTYRQRIDTGPDGTYAFTTPYPGTYEVGNETVTVPESAVRDGTTINVSRT